MDFADHPGMAGSPHSCTCTSRYTMAIGGHFFLKHAFAPTTSPDFYLLIPDEVFNRQDRAVSDAMDRGPCRREMAARLSACWRCTRS